MPYETVDGTVVVYSGISDETEYIYNLASTPSKTHAYLLSVQVVFSGGTDLEVSFYMSNDGVHFSPIPDQDYVSLTDGTIIADLGTPGYQFLLVDIAPNSSSVNTTLIFNAVNLS